MLGQRINEGWPHFSCRNRRAGTLLSELISADTVPLGGHSTGPTLSQLKTALPEAQESIPVFPPQTRDTAEFLNVVGDEGCLMRQGGSSNQIVHRPQWASCFF